MTVTKLRHMLMLLERRIIPAPGTHHALMHMEYGSDADGWESRLALQLNCAGQLRVFFFEDDDFELSAEDLVEAVVQAL